MPTHFFGLTEEDEREISDRNKKKESMCVSERTRCGIYRRQTDLGPAFKTVFHMYLDEPKA